MANRWKKWKEWQTLFSWTAKPLQMVTAAMKLKDTCSWKKSYDKPRQHNKKQKYHFADADLCSQSYGFSSSHVQMWELNQVQMWELEHWRIGAFELWDWRRLLRFPWTVRRSNQSILKEINPDIYWTGWCWSWSSNTLATWCKEPTHWKKPRYWEDWSKRRREWQRMKWLHSITNSLENPMDRGACWTTVHGVTKSWT